MISGLLELTLEGFRKSLQGMVPMAHAFAVQITGPDQARLIIGKLEHANAFFP